MELDGVGAVGGVRLPTGAELAWYQFCRSLLFIPVWLMWRPRMLGRENLPQTTPYILAPVHRSYVDTLLTGYVTRRRLRYMAKSGVFAKPWAAKLFGSLGGFPVRRGTPDRDALKVCEQALAVGEPVVLFPEGTRGSGPVLGPLLGGPAFLALRANVPIVPVGIGGSERSMAVGAKWVRPARIGIVIGKPIWPPPRPGNDRVPRRLITEMTARLRDELQADFDQARALAGD
jgi:1-acyl-sn-glycerol-3-phosphate acyltransferase